MRVTKCVIERGGEKEVELRVPPFAVGRCGSPGPLRPDVPVEQEIVIVIIVVLPVF